MSEPFDLKIDIDLKEKFYFPVNCKQNDNINLIFNIYNNSVVADLNNFDYRLRALKPDRKPVIQRNNININKNVVTIGVDPQLTTASGVVQAEIQLIDKTTNLKKHSFNIAIRVISSVLEVDRTISKATYDLLTELEYNLDKVDGIEINWDRAEELNTSLIAENNEAVSNISSLKTENNKAPSNISNLKVENDRADSNIPNLKTENENADDKLDKFRLYDTTNLIQQVQDNTTQLSQNAQDISDLQANKANKSDLDSTNANVTANTNAISINTADISNNASNIAIHTSQITSLASGAPKAVSLVANMTDVTKNYVYTGSEIGYTNGNWYYYNGSAWVSGGVYQSAGIANKSIVFDSLSDCYKNQFVQLTSSNDLNLISKDGIYVCVSPANSPSGFTTFFLEVNSYQAETAGTARWVIQKAYSYFEPSIVWMRKIDIKTPANNTSWAKQQVGEKAVSRINLSDSYSYIIGNLTTTNNDTLNKKMNTGVYVVEANVTGKPDALASVTCFLEVILVGRFVVQRIYNYTDPSSYYVREFDGDTTSYGTWKLVSLFGLNRDNLGGSFLSKYTFLDSTYDLNNIKDDGIYIVTSAANKPAMLINTGMLEVHGYKSDSTTVRWVIQTIRDYYNPTIMYVRKVDTLSSTNNTEWTTIGLSKLQGKTLVCFGDSITEGQGATTPGTDSYPAVLKTLYGINVINKGIGGASWQNDGVYDNISIIYQVENTDFTNVDYVTIFAGTNDFGRGALPIGTNEDTVKTTLKGAINNVIQHILNDNPNIKIGIITPIWRQRLSSGDNKDSDFNTVGGKYLKEYVDAIKDSADYNHIKCLDFYHTCGINKYNYATFLADGLHPNTLGYKEKIAKPIHSFLETL